MKLRLRTAACLFVGLAAAAAWLLPVGGPFARSGEEKKPDSGKIAGKDTKKPAGDTDPKPGPYPEDPLNSPAEKSYAGSGAYRWLNVALQATAREHERHGARPTIGSR